MTAFQWYMGAHHPDWLSKSPVPLCVSFQSIRKYKTLPRAVVPWVLDSGGFTEITKHGGYSWSVREHVARVRQIRDECGSMVWASQMDWMCEEQALKKTGKTVRDHMRLTVENYLELMSIAPDVPWLPVVQGDHTSDYRDCLEAYDKCGVNLAALPAVGVGTLCKRKELALRYYLGHVVQDMAEAGMKVHAFGLRVKMLGPWMDRIVSADSLSWSALQRYAFTGEQNELDAALFFHKHKIAPLYRDPLFFEKRSAERLELEIEYDKWLAENKARKRAYDAERQEEIDKGRGTVRRKRAA